MNTEHRRAHRIAVNLPTVVEAIGQPPFELHPNLREVYERVAPTGDRLGDRFPAAIRDLSTNGAFVAGEPLPLLSRVAFSFTLPEIGTIEVIGWTMWRRSAECELPVSASQTVTLPPGFGVLFEAIPLDARVAIHKLVLSRRLMSFFRSDTITLEAALRDIRSGDARTRAAAAAALGDVEPAHRDEAVGALVPALNDPSPDIRAAAASSLGELGGPRAVNQLTLCLDDQIAIVRQTAAIALGKIGDPESFEPLATALRDGPPDLRFQAATSLAEIDQVRAFEPLLAALDDADPEVLGAAALSLGAIGDARAAERIAPLLDHARELTRFDAAYALARMSDARAVPVLAACAARPDLAWDAIESLELLGNGAATDALAAALADRKRTRSTQVHAAAALLAAAPEHPAAAMARAELTAAVALWWKPDARALAIQQLGRVGGAWAERALHAARGRWTSRGVTDEIDDALRRIRHRLDPE